jgi:hypothetical protein
MLQVFRCQLRTPDVGRSSFAWPTGLIREYVVIVGLILGGILTNSCGSGCPSRLASRLVFSSFGDTTKSVPCCGGSVFQDVNLTGADIREVDLANSQVNSGRVDAFLTAPDCSVLFDGPYNGPPAQSRCRVLIGPVAPGEVSERLAIPKGTYRVFAQAWASNENENIFDIDVGLYSDKCHPNLTGPSR